MTEVPALAYTPSFSADVEDIRLPKLYVGQNISKPVENGLAKAGDIYAATGPDDLDVNVVYTKGGDGVLVYVLNYTKRLAAGTGADFRIYSPGDPEAPADAYPTWTFDLAIPEVDESLPHKMSMSRSQAPTAKNIITVLSRNPNAFSAFRLKTLQKENAKGRWYIPTATAVEVDTKQLEVVSSLGALFAQPSQPQITAATDAPAI